jgi:hypothetical protein
LEKFHGEQGHYPAHLQDLVPTYLPDVTALLPRGKIDPAQSPRAAASAQSHEVSSLDAFWYRVDADAYSLSFSYTGPGINDCWYESKTRKWKAHGYY